MVSGRVIPLKKDKHAQNYNFWGQPKQVSVKQLGTWTHVSQDGNIFFWFFQSKAHLNSGTPCFPPLTSYFSVLRDSQAKQHPLSQSPGVFLPFFWGKNRWTYKEETVEGIQQKKRSQKLTKLGLETKPKMNGFCVVPGVGYRFCRYLPLLATRSCCKWSVKLY